MSKQIQYDLRRGLLRWQYLAIPLVAVLPCLLLIQSINICQLHATWGDFMFHIFNGIEPIRYGYGETFVFPLFWLVVIEACLLMNLNYFLEDLTTAGQQILIRSGSRRKWFLSKCIWNICSCLWCFILIIAVVTLVTLLTGSEFSFDLTAELMSTQYAWKDGMQEVLPHGAGLIIGCLIPFLSLCALSMAEMALCVYIKPILTFILLVTQLILAVFINSPFVLGNGTMALRSELVAIGGQSPVYAVVTALLILIAATVIGSAGFSHMDILEAKD